MNVHLRPGPELEKAEREVAEYQRFRDLVGEVTEVNEAICGARPARPAAPPRGPLRAGGEKGAPARLEEDAAAEIGGWRGSRAGAGRGRGAGGCREGDARRDAEAGGGMLGTLLAGDDGYRGPRVPCGHGHDAEFVSYRDKVIDTVLGPVTLTRAWYHCAACGHGFAPREPSSAWPARRCPRG